jgi:hypothetical protein
MRRRRQRPMLAAMGLALLAGGCNCGHTRQSMYPGGTRSSNDDIHIRAPFVDVRVPRINKRSPKGDMGSTRSANIRPSYEGDDSGHGSTRTVDVRPSYDVDD